MNDEKLKALLIEGHQYQDSLGPAEVETWDSLAMVEIAGAVEREFACSLEPDEMVSLQSVGEIKTILRSRGHGFPE